MPKVFVVAWEYDTGGGFDWYYNAYAADVEFEVEKRNCHDPILAKENWTAFRFDVEVESFETTTDEIDAKLCELCDECQNKYPKGR